MFKLNKKTLIIGAAILSTIAFGAESCDSSTTSDAAKSEDANRTKTYTSLVEAQPAHSMKYSPTRATKNFWIDTWGVEGKLSYVYLLNAEGKPFGYYILEGLPVSYCTSLVPPVKEWDVDQGEYNGSALGPAPSVDGTYSSSSNCSTYYGKDATSGAYIEYTAGLGINPFIYDQPAQQFASAQPLGDATLENVK